MIEPLDGFGEGAMSSVRVLSFDIPGSLMLAVQELFSEDVASLDFRNAAEDAPRSSVCRNHEGSLLPNDCMICAFDTPLASSLTGSRSRFGDVASVSLSLLETCWDGWIFSLNTRCDGRCCHDIAPDWRFMVSAAFFSLASFCGVNDCDC